MQNSLGAQADTPWEEAALPHLLQDHQSWAAQFVNMKHRPAEKSMQSRAVQRKGVLMLKKQKSPHQVSYIPSAQYLSSTTYLQPDTTLMKFFFFSIFLP